MSMIVGFVIAMLVLTCGLIVGFVIGLDVGSKTR